MNLLALIVFSLALGWTAFRSAGVLAFDWNVTLLAICPISALLLRRPQAPPLPAAIRWPLLLLPLWIAVQFLTPISVFPNATLAQWMRAAGYILVFHSIRELSWRYCAGRAPWAMALPLVLVAGLEASLGLAQFYSLSGTAARGTYVNRDHFAGLLEMVLPFPLTYGFSFYWNQHSRFESPLRPALIACGAFAAAALLLLGIIHSLSRMGFIVALFVLCLLGASVTRRRIWRVAVPLAGAALFLFLPPDALVDRFSQLSNHDRADMWRETLPLIAAHPLTGCGLGTYESAFMRYKRSRPSTTDDYAHNDYLQYIAELGIPAFLLGVLLLAAVAVPAIHAVRAHAAPSCRALALACLASFVALLLHSFVDFNSRIPANAFAISWIAGLAALPAKRGLVRDSQPSRKFGDSPRSCLDVNPV